MKKLMVVSLAVLAFVSVFTTNVWSGFYQLDFSISEFSAERSTSTPAPFYPISGSVEFEAASINSIIDALASIDLTIGNYTYQISEIGLAEWNDENNTLIGRNDTDSDDLANAITHGTDDFWLFWNPSTLEPRSFAYSTSEVPPGFWSAYDFDSFSITSAAPVPEPSTFLLLGGGLAGLAFYARRRRKE